MTLRRLLVMAKAKQRHDWSIGCDIIATLWNVNGGNDGKSVHGSELNPFAKPVETGMTEAEQIAIEVDQARALCRGAWGGS